MKRRTAWSALGLGMLLVVTGIGFGLGQAATAVTSVASGNWTNPAIWSTGVVPGATDAVTVAVGTSVTYDAANATVSGVTIAAGGMLTFNPGASATLKTNANVVVDGTLVMRPASASVQHLLQFVNVNEAAFTGQTMTPDMVTATDVGLWVENHGRLDLVGTQKTGWTKAVGAIAQGATSVTLATTPVGWAAGDTITIAPTQAPTVGAAAFTGFDESTLTAVNGATLTLGTATARPHPQVNGQWTAEVANLTRNVRIEGTATGRAHIMSMGDRPQTINYVGIRYMGPRANHLGFMSRYGLHLHFMGDGSRGSQVIGTVARDIGNHAFVPHASHGVTFRDDVTYNTIGEAYWWNDLPSTGAVKTNDVLYDHDLAANVNSDGQDEAQRLAGFDLLSGDQNTIRNSTAVGVHGGFQASGFIWPSPNSAEGHGLWDFSEGNVGHNNTSDGIFNWQNNLDPHIVANFTGYHNGQYGIENGAYSQRFRYENSILYGNGKAGLNLMATGANRFENMTIDGAGISAHLVNSYDHHTDGTTLDPIVISHSTFANATSSVLDFGTPFAPNLPAVVSLEYSTIVNVPTDVTFAADTQASNVAYVQPNATSAERVTPTGRTVVAPYAVSSDIAPPQVALVSPTGGTQVSGAVAVQASTYDQAGVTKVELFVDGALTDTVTAAPFTTHWNAPLTSGLHHLMLRAWDAAGHSSESNVVTVSTGCPFAACPTPTADTMPPIVRLVPLVKDGQDKPDAETVQIMGRSEDIGGQVVEVDFYFNGALSRADTNEPFLMPSWLTTSYPNGTYTWTAVAIDSSGNRWNAAPVTVTVQH